MGVIDDAFKNPKPFITAGSMSWLEKNLKNTMTGIEYGGGSSTLWFLKRLNELYTIEGSAIWSKRLIEEVSNNQQFMYKWRLFFIECNWQIDHLNNRWYIKTKVPEKNILEMEKAYCQFEIANPDFILVDGAIRYLALKQAVKMLKNRGIGGILCVDNMELKIRQEYVKEVIPDNWERIDFKEEDSKVPAGYFNHPNHNGEWITSIWVVK